MYVVTVTFEIDNEHLEAFAAEMLAQARNSLEREAGCMRFDVCRDQGDPAITFLYEIYKDEGAFKRHLETDHYRKFDGTVAPWVRRKSVRTWTLASTKA